MQEWTLGGSPIYAVFLLPPSFYVVAMQVCLREGRGRGGHIGIEARGSQGKVVICLEEDHLV